MQVEKTTALKTQKPEPKLTQNVCYSRVNQEEPDGFLKVIGKAKWAKPMIGKARWAKPITWKSQMG